MEINEAWSEIVPNFVKYPYLAYKRRHFLQYWLKRGALLMGRGKSDVVILGRSAVGKSLLTDRLRGLPGDLNWVAPGISRSVESAVLRAGSKPMIIRTIPGQVSRERDAGIHEAMSEHNHLRGVIYVADWGYTDVRDESVRRDQIDREGIDTLEKVRQSNLTAEVADFNEVTLRIRESIARCGKPVWLLIVVNKADLFFDRMDEAQAYYHPQLESAFTAPLRRLIEHVGNNNLRCNAVPVCSWLEDFSWNNETEQSKMGEGQARLLFKNLHQKVAQLSDSES